MTARPRAPVKKLPSVAYWVAVPLAILGIGVALRVIYVAVQDGIGLQNWDPAFYVLVPGRMRRLDIPQEQPGRMYSSRIGDGAGESCVRLKTVSGAKPFDIFDVIERQYIKRGATFTRERQGDDYPGTERHYRYGRLRVEVRVAGYAPAREVIVYEYEVKYDNY